MVFSLDLGVVFCVKFLCSFHFLGYDYRDMRLLFVDHCSNIILEYEFKCVKSQTIGIKVRFKLVSDCDYFLSI